ncbi:histidine kinase [Streptomyces durbertensis]|uniref:histidine kinase n=2 Tax=Streptomyces durbertensis TaxID=2448886 RepID=A0ABR6EC76_9ACTN|nr:histidine kinase [Streptomyces durbertensis]
MPGFLLAEVLLAVWGGSQGNGVLFRPGAQFTAYALAVVLTAPAGLFPVARPLCAHAAQVLAGVTAARLEASPARSWAARRRTACWLALHTGAGALVAGGTLAIPPAAVLLIALPFSADGSGERWWWAREFHSAPALLAPVAGILLLLLLVAAALYAGRVSAHLAARLLGPTPADRLAAAERRAERLAAGNRLARDLHDSVGHALSAVTLQAAAAGRLLDRDREFTRRALVAIEETARRAVGELDAVLGALREDERSDAAADPISAAPTLTGLDALVSTTRSAGATVRETRSSGLEDLPAAVSREAYRIVQEALTNVLRPAGPVAVRLDLTVHRKELTIVVENEPPPEGRQAGPGGGGRGLTGMAERAALLGGSVSAGPRDGGWRVHARLPVGDT